MTLGVGEGGGVVEACFTWRDTDVTDTWTCPTGRAGSSGIAIARTLGSVTPSANSS
jgi:hypothetical protein